MDRRNRPKTDIIGGSVVVAFLRRNGRWRVLLSWLTSALVSFLTTMFVLNYW